MKDVSPSQKTFSLHGIPEHLLAGVDPCLTSIWIWYGGLHPERLITMKQEMNVTNICHLSVGKGNGWSGEGCWFGAGIMFVGFIWEGAVNICQFPMSDNENTRPALTDKIKK